MIITPSAKRYQRLGTDWEILMLPKFRVFYRYAPTELSVDIEPKTGYDIENLSSEVYGEYVEWETNLITITAEFPAQQIHAILLGNPSFDEARITIYNGDKVILSSTRPRWIDKNRVWTLGNPQSRGLVFSRGEDSFFTLKRETAPNTDSLDITDQHIIPILTGSLTATKVVIDLRGGAETGTLNKLWIGQYDEWMAGSGADYPLVIKGNGGLTDVGTVYGRILPSVRQFHYSWDVVDDVVRRQIETYMDAVQLSKAHYIMPFVEDAAFIPCMFVRLSTDTAKNNRHIAGWYWNSPELEYDILR
jgi:hypothetical protein